MKLALLAACVLIATVSVAVASDAKLSANPTKQRCNYPVESYGGGAYVMEIPFYAMPEILEDVTAVSEEHWIEVLTQACPYFADINLLKQSEAGLGLCWEVQASESSPQDFVGYSCDFQCYNPYDVNSANDNKDSGFARGKGTKGGPPLDVFIQNSVMIMALNFGGDDNLAVVANRRTSFVDDYEFEIAQAIFDTQLAEFVGFEGTLANETMPEPVVVGTGFFTSREYADAEEAETDVRITGLDIIDWSGYNDLAKGSPSLNLQVFGRDQIYIGLDAELACYPPNNRFYCPSGRFQDWCEGTCNHEPSVCPQELCGDCVREVRNLWDDEKDVRDLSFYAEKYAQK